MKQASQTLLTVIAAAALTACAGGAGYTPRTPATFDASANPSRLKTAPVVIKITLPHESRGTVNPRYVSPATASIVIKVVPETGPPKIFAADLTRAENHQCKPSKTGIVCSVRFALRPGRYGASVATYDGLLDANRRPTGNRLSANQHLPLRVRATGLTLGIDLSLDGLPASVVFVPAFDSTLSGNASTGYVLPKCSTGQSVNVFGADADGNVILGPGAPAVSLSSDDEGQLVVTSPSRKSPNDFTLSPPSLPAYPFAHFAVHLTATVKPLRGGGGAIRSQNVNVTYSGDICGVISEFTVPDNNSSPAGIVTGPDGAVWFAESAANKIGRISTAGTITAATVPTAGSGPQDIALGPDGALWFTEYLGNKIGRITTNGAISEIPIALPGSKPYGITAGPDGAMWFMEYGAPYFGRIQGGAITNQFPGPNQGAEIVAGPDGNLWATDSGGAILEYSPGPASLQAFLTPYAPSRPSGIAFSSNGALYFTDISANAIGYVAQGTTIVAFHTLTIVSEPFGITKGPDGAMWFTEYAGNRIGRITPDQTITETELPTAGSVPYDIALGPDGALWFTENGGNKIGRLR